MTPPAIAARSGGFADGSNSQKAATANGSEAMTVGLCQTVGESWPR
jgi:hypothetical protein